MKLSDLPIHLPAFPGESVRSWLDATRRELSLSEAEWWRWCNCQSVEHERPGGGRIWQDLPPAIGDITSIPPSWRIAVDWRRRFCPACFTKAKGGTRHPTLVDWLDARAIACAEHRLLLCENVPSPVVGLEVNKEVELLYDWLQAWRTGGLDRSRDLLARDLVIASTRNWGCQHDAIASCELIWVVAELGWPAPRQYHSYRPGSPSRVGQLAPIERAAALLGAFRAWSSLWGERMDKLPRWPLPAWVWLQRRCGERGQSSHYRQLRSIVSSYGKVVRRKDGF